MLAATSSPQQYVTPIQRQKARASRGGNKVHHGVDTGQRVPSLGAVRCWTWRLHSGESFKPVSANEFALVDEVSFQAYSLEK